jgi:hypothetical protein
MEIFINLNTKFLLALNYGNKLKYMSLNNCPVLLNISTIRITSHYLHFYTLPNYNSSPNIQSNILWCEGMCDKLQILAITFLSG